MKGCRVNALGNRGNTPQCLLTPGHICPPLPSSPDMGAGHSSIPTHSAIPSSIRPRPPASFPLPLAVRPSFPPLPPPPPPHLLRDAHAHRHACTPQSHARWRVHVGAGAQGIGGVQGELGCGEAPPLGRSILLLLLLHHFQGWKGCRCCRPSPSYRCTAVVLPPYPRHCTAVGSAAVAALHPNPRHCTAAGSAAAAAVVLPSVLLVSAICDHQALWPGDIPKRGDGEGGI